MKKVIPESRATSRILAVQKEMGGVFSTADLYHVLGDLKPLNNQRAINRLVSDGLLRRVKRGLYVLGDFDAPLLASRLIPQSYLSMDTVLIANGLVGTLNPSRISCVTSRHTATVFHVPPVTIEYHSIHRNLFCGFETFEHGIRRADNEKAWLDLMVFHLRGVPYPFDPKNEVHLDRLDLKRVHNYLKKYKNPKFRTFINKLLKGGYHD